MVCPNEGCNKHHVINSDDKIIFCDCGTVSNISYLELFRSNIKDMNQSEPKSPTNNPVDKNRMNLLKELDIQKNRVAQVDKLKDKQDALLKEISLMKKQYCS